MGKRRGNDPPTVPMHVLLDAMSRAWAANPRDAMILETLAETGMRNGECRLLQINDVWTGGDVVLSVKLRPEQAKGGVPRTIPLTGSFRTKLRKWILDNRHIVNGGMETCPLYPSQKAEGFLTRRGMCRIVRKYFSLAGSPATPHYLRHTCATELLRVTNARVVQLMLGHQRLETVQIYTHPTEDDLRGAMNARAAAKEKFAVKNQEIGSITNNRP